jgi:translation initiation factor IF-2
MATINQTIDFETASLVASDFDFTVENVAFDAESVIEEAHVATEEGEAKEPRPPVVTVMGHVDHGKTSLLDAIRQANVAAGEAGGITQHIGAYTVSWNGRRITFIDTPGHEAFTAMRARGAKVTDIVILVVAADDGVMPQTVEAIHHARAAEVPIVVAINKIDLPDADPERVKRELADHGVVAEEWGGDVTMVPVSAKTKQGLPELLEMILLQADVLDLRANPNKLARGVILEAKLERGRGPVATVLVQEGTLRVGDPFVCGTLSGRVRAMMDENGARVAEAGPSTPVEILGFQGVPEAGDLFTAMADEATAKQVAAARLEKKRQAQLTATSKISLEDLYQRIKAGEAKELRVIVKADVQGSVEALQEALGRLSTEEVKLTILHASVGGVSESDVLLASASDAVVVGFNVRPEAKAAETAEREGVEIRLYSVIYEVLNDMRAALEGMLAPTLRERILGRAEVRQTFAISGVGTVAGSFVTEGKVVRAARVRLVRDNVVVYEGRIASLRRFKEDVREVAAGYECGIGLENYSDVKPGDVIEAFEVEEVARRLVSPPARGNPPAERTV